MVEGALLKMATGTSTGWLGINGTANRGEGVGRL